MAKVNIKGLPQLTAALKKFINESASREEILLRIGIIGRESIIAKTRTGKNLVTGGKQKALKASTVKHREILAKSNPVQETFSAKRSNLTLTGQLLESIKIIPSKSKAEVNLVPKGTRKPYVNKNGKSQKGTPTNEDLTEYLSQKGFKFLGIDEPTKKQMIKAVKAFLRNEIKKSIFRTK